MKKQYKMIPAKTKEYEGSGGVIVGGVKKRLRPYRLFIDEKATHTLVIGAERSGKTEMFTFPMIDALSRAKVKSNLIINDLRGELAKASSETLKTRGYDVHVIDFSKDVIDIELGDLPVAVFMVSDILNRQSIHRVSDFVSKFYKGVKNGRQTHFLLDDFSKIPQIKGFSEILTRSKHYGTHFHFTIYSYGQLESLYGEESDVIISNCSNQIYILTYDKQTAERYSRLLGTKVVEGIERPIITPEELMSLNKGESVVFCVNRKPIFNTGVIAQRFRWEYLSDDSDCEG